MMKTSFKTSFLHHKPGLADGAISESWGSTPQNVKRFYELLNRVAFLYCKNEKPNRWENVDRKPLKKMLAGSDR